LIDEEYAKTLATLQDQVPPFSDVVAKQILKSELGDDKYQALGFVSSSGAKHAKPIASASIGQVYKTKWGDTDVAVKVQRPNVLAEIALDLYIVREYVAPLYQKLQNSATDLQALANEWGRGFIAELDYDREAEATTRFSRAMKERNLNAVCAPRVLFHTPQVLITEWVDGRRIDDVTYNKEEIPRYCSIALNAYLCMLLELQSLHCDPHPVRKTFIFTAGTFREISKTLHRMSLTGICVFFFLFREICCAQEMVDCAYWISG
jgi:predicted unusual protein kinase regulating ubiquinone biosynthesis (AarF/ABC1/UbiB family)